MNNIFSKKVNSFKGMKVNVERFETANDLVKVSATREITSSQFDDYRKKQREDFTGVKTYEEALEMLKTGYQPTVDKMQETMKNVKSSGESKRISFFNDVVGFQPIVPLAIMGVPNSMTNMYMKPIKSKVVNVYYDMTVNCGITKEQLLAAGQKVLGVILQLEKQGYKFNLYATQTYSTSLSADMCCVKIKNANTPLDLKRISFPLTHPAFFRVIGFDWYSRFPKGIYRSGLGHTFTNDWSAEQIDKAFEEIFNEKCVVFSAQKIVNESEEQIKGRLTNEQ